MASFDLIGLVVKDMAASLAFYRLLGVDIPDDADQESHVEVTLENGPRLAWDSLDMLKEIYPEWETEPVGHRVTLAFLCESPETVDALYQQVTEQGYEGYRAPWDAFWGQRYAVVKDPDGNLVDLFAALPGEDTDA